MSHFADDDTLDMIKRLEQQLSRARSNCDNKDMQIEDMKRKLAEAKEQLAAKSAEIERLLGVLCEIAGSKSLTATPTQFYQHLQRIASYATMGH